jgi:hypothetical protein
MAMIAQQVSFLSFISQLLHSVESFCRISALLWVSCLPWPWQHMQLQGLLWLG